MSQLDTKGEGGGMSQLENTEKGDVSIGRKERKGFIGGRGYLKWKYEGGWELLSK